MKRIRKIQEIFDSPTEWRYVSSYSHYDEYKFDLISDDKKFTYNVTFTITFFEELSEEEFQYTDYVFLYDNYVVEEDDFPLKVAKLEFSLSGISYRNEYGITGTGNQFTVFSTVLEILKSWSNDNSNVDILLFSAKEKSRQRLYRTFAKNISKELNDFYFDNEYTSSGNLMFVFKRI